MNENKIENIIRKQFDQSSHQDDYIQLWNDLEPRLPKKRRVIPFWILLVGLLIGSTFIASYLINSIAPMDSKIVDESEFKLVYRKGVKNIIDKKNYNKLTLLSVDSENNDPNKSKGNLNNNYGEYNDIEIIMNNKFYTKSNKPVLNNKDKANFNFKSDVKNYLNASNKKPFNLEKQIIENRNLSSMPISINPVSLDGIFFHDILSLGKIDPIQVKYLKTGKRNLPIYFVNTENIKEKGKSKIQIGFHLHYGLPIASYLNLSNPNAYEKLIRDNLKITKAFEFGIQVPLKTTQYFELNIRLSYLNIEERFDFKGEHSYTIDSLNQNAFLVNGLTLLASDQAYNEILDIDVFQRNQFEMIKISPVLTLKTKGITSFGLSLIPEYAIYQNYNGVLIDSNYKFKDSGVIVDSRKFRKLNWSTEFYIKKQFSKSTFGRFSFYYSQLNMQNGQSVINGLRSVQIYSLGASIEHVF